MKAVFQKVKGGLLAPVCDQAIKFVDSMKLGDGASVEATKARNIKFHRKFFKLIELAFDVWEPAGEQEYRGEKLSKNIETFRKHILILAGHYTASYGIDGNVHLEAKSISFAKCDEYEFNDVYAAVLRVVWEKILRHAHFASEQEVELVVNQLLAFE